MTDYTELVKALRICGKGDCVDCDRQRQDKCLKRHWNNENLIDGMLCEAAAAIEALQAELEKKRTADCWGCKCEKLEPKRGEWKCSYPEIEPNPMFMYGICSICGFEQSISNQLNYCPNCGAKMEVQDANK